MFALPASARVSAPAFTPVRGGLLQRNCACGGRPGADGECEQCRRQRLQRKPKAAPGVDDVLRSTGEPLNHGTRAFMEERFTHDFSRVRVHTDAAAAASARSLHALAYTVGNDIVFAEGRFAPQTAAGNHLLAHELTHVVQQGGRGGDFGGMVDEHDATEHEANAAARAVSLGKSAAAGFTQIGPSLQRHKDDIVAYSGGQSAALFVIQAGKLIYTAPAVSGHPGHGENEPSAGPIPTGKYVLHPGVTQPTVTKDQGGVCGAGSAGTGYQEITSNDPTPCSLAHYCNVPCPTKDEPARKCYTPVDCWGPKRIKIEGSQAVVTPAGKHAVRDGFYIHGGNPKDAVSSGCVKSLDNGVFAEIRKLTGVKGAVPFCVGSACPPAVDAAVQKVVGQVIEALIESIPLP